MTIIIKSTYYCNIKIDESISNMCKKFIHSYYYFYNDNILNIYENFKKRL